MKKSKDMPVAQTFNYAATYKATPLFVNDLKKVLGDVAYIDAIELFKELEDREYVFPAAALNEFIMKIESFPYRYVNPIMEVINREDCFLKYFEVISNKLQ